MGADPKSKEMENFEAFNDGCISDTVAFTHVVQVLSGVRMPAGTVSPADRDQYEDLLTIIDPSKRRMSPDDEALLVTAFKALTSAVSKIDAIFHGSLLSNIFAMSIWNYGVETRSAILELIVVLACVPDKFLDGCLHMLVSNFLPHGRLLELLNQPRWGERKVEIHGQLHEALHLITNVVPLVPMKLKDVIDRSMPKCNDSKMRIMVFTECLLGLERKELGDFIGMTLLSKVMDLLADLDVNITWEEILQEDQNKGIFDMELEDLDDGADDDDEKKLQANAFAEKLDWLMVTVCEHLKLCKDMGTLCKEFDGLLYIFRRSLLRLHKSKFVQFVIFYACSLEPEICGVKFAVFLTDIFLAKAEDEVTRMSAVSYLGSYLSRAKFVSSSTVATILGSLVNYCSNYCQVCPKMLSNLRAHRIFYSGMQVVMYVLCFRLRSLMSNVDLKDHIFSMRLDFILDHPLDPLKVCLPSIVHEFLRQGKAARLFKSGTEGHENAVESNLSKGFGGLERLDMFFPFDPYLLKESDRFMRPNFEFWSMVSTSYSDCNSEDEDFEDVDVPDFMENGKFDDSDELCSNNSDDQDRLGCSLNKMSITPIPAPMLPMPARMPAKIMPSTSPVW